MSYLSYLAQEEIHREVCLQFYMSLPWVYPELSKSRYFIALRLGITRRYQPVSQSVPQNYLFYGYGIRASNNGVIRFLHNPCSAFSYVKIGLIKPSKRYRAPRAHRLKKRRSKEEIFHFQSQKKKEERRRKSVIQNHLRHCPPNMSDRRVPKGKGPPIQ